MVTTNSEYIFSTFGDLQISNGTETSTHSIKMDNKGKVKLKSCMNRNREPLLKPDVILITKDLMVPLKLPISTAQNCLKTKLRTEKAQRFCSQPIKPVLSSEDLRQNYIKHSLPQVKKILPGKKTGEETVSKNPFYCPLRANANKKIVCVKEIEAVSLERENLDLRSNLELFDLDLRDKRHIESVNISQVEKSLISPRNSTSSVTTSAETQSCSSSKSLDIIEDLLPKPPLSIISSSESESNICAPDRRVSSEYCSRIFVENDHNQNSSTKEGTDVDELIIEYPQNDRDNEERVKTDLKIDVFEENLIMIDVEYLMQCLLTNLETIENFNGFGNCKEIIAVEKTSLQDTVQNFKEESFINKSECNLNERIPKMIEFRYSLHDLVETVLPSNNYDYSSSKQIDIDSGRKYSWQELDLLNSTVTEIKSDEKEESKTIYNNPDNNSNQNNEQIEIKYSWQIINGQNSKQTSTEDFCGLEFRYSWQKLTSRYLARKHAEDSLTDTNQPAPNVNDIPKSTSNTECVKDHSPLRETCPYSSNLNTNLKKEENSKTAKDIGRILTTSPLNNIISSMLPEIKLIKRRISFNDTTADIVGNRRDNYLRTHERSDSNKSSTSYSSVSSIKHVIENLNEMVKSQKDMLEAYVKNHELDKNFKVTEPLVNPVRTVEKVEIFPSTLHVLGDYIVRDIRPADMNDQRSLLDSNHDETIKDHLLSGFDKPVENIFNKKIPRSNDTCSQLPVDLKLKDTDFSSFSNHPVSFDSNSYPTIYTTDGIFTPKINKLLNKNPGSFTSEENRSSLLLPVLGKDRTLSKKNWEPAIADMEEMVGLSLDAARCMNEGKDDGNKAVPHTKNTGPLMPKVKVSFTETKEAAGDSKTRKEELLARLEGAMNRLKQSEEHIDANWNLDYSVLDIEESSSDNEVQLPKQVEDHIKDIIKSAEEYLAKLEEQLNDLRNADDQIINSSERTFKDIDESYQIFMDNLCQEINKRRNLLRLETEVFKYEGLAPLRACKQEVDAQIRSTQHLIVLTENMLTHPITFNKERLGTIITATSHMGRIPAVPMPEELPYVTFRPPNEEIWKEISDRISCLGCVLRMGPAQFTEVCERPAGLQLKWHIVDPEYALEEQVFIVQKALGEIFKPCSPAFENVYIGPETSCLVRDIPVDQRVTLRVGVHPLKIGVTDIAWSVHRIAQTSIPAYSWDTNNSDYLITNNGRIATKVTQNFSTLLSTSAQFSAKHIIEFKFLEAASGTDDEGIGLVFEPGGDTETLKRNGAILITPNGNIFMNGEQKLMQLPKMELGTRIVFTSEEKDDETLRMTIECANKAVTYDWTVQRPLHFAARFLEHHKWNLVVK